MEHEIDYQNHAEYKLTKRFYADAVSNGIPFINHIHEGVHILQIRKQEVWTQRAFCLYPVFETDEMFINQGLEYIKNTGADYSVTCALEFRGIVNSNDIRLSPIDDVNEMLIAEKVQKRKDFEKYTHHDAKTEIYFHEWLEALKVDENTYNRYVKELSLMTFADP